MKYTPAALIALSFAYSTSAYTVLTRNGPSFSSGSELSVDKRRYLPEHQTTSIKIPIAYPYEFVPKNRLIGAGQLSESKTVAKEWSARCQNPPKVGLHDILDYDK